MTDAVLDASAVIALLSGEPGGGQVKEYLPGALMSSVNLAEVLTRLVDRGVPGEAARQAVLGLGLRVVDFDTDHALLVAQLRPATRHLGLSLGDRACLALGMLLDAQCVTADRVWASLVEPRVVVVERSQVP